MSRILEIKTPRLVLNEFCSEDFPRLMSILLRMQEAGQYWFNACPSNPASVKALLDKALSEQKMSPRDTYRMAIRHRKDSGGLSLIGYVSLCDVFASKSGVPDTGVFINPDFQRGRYGREARLGIMLFAFSSGIDAIYCDIAVDNDASQKNVLGMGYEMVLNEHGHPQVFNFQTLNGPDSVYRFVLTQENFWEVIPDLVTEHISKCGLSDDMTRQFDHAVTPLSKAQQTLAAKSGFVQNFGPFSVHSDCAPGCVFAEQARQPA